MALQKAIVHEAVSIVEKRALTCLKHFRYAYLTRSQGSAAAATGGHASQDNLLAQPVALGKLAHFLVEIHRVNSKWVGTKARPLILLVSRECELRVASVLRAQATSFTCPYLTPSWT